MIYLNTFIHIQRNIVKQLAKYYLSTKKIRINMFMSYVIYHHIYLIWLIFNIFINYYRNHAAAKERMLLSTVKTNATVDKIVTKFSKRGDNRKTLQLPTEYTIICLFHNFTLIFNKTICKCIYISTISTIILSNNNIYIQ